MKRILRAISDTYITNRVIGGKFRATDANVGLAGTLDLFKLAGESNFTASGPFVSGTTDPIELSRILIKFDVRPLMSFTSSILDISNPSFSCILRLVDVLGGQTVPSNFSLILYPLAQPFDEGIGRDVNAFEDIDVANYLTASVSSGLSVWNSSGADAKGYIGQAGVDVFTGSTGLGDMFVVQAFGDGTEDLMMDVTKVVSATLTGQIPDYGYRISFSGTQETDDRTRFVKRFATRHSTDPMLRPMIEVGFDDSIGDHHRSFFFDLSGSLFLNNFARGVPANIVSGVALTPISGPGSLMVTLVSGNYASGSLFSKSVLASQHTVGLNAIVGVYSASFAISPWESGTLLEEVKLAHSATFTEIWGSLDGTVGYHTGTLVVYDADRTSFINDLDSLRIGIKNLGGVLQVDEKVRLRVFVQDDGSSVVAKKLPFEAESLIFTNMHYRVVDVNSDEPLFDFDTARNSTRLSTDSEGMYFDLYAADLNVGRSYGIDILLDERGSRRIFRNVGGTFRIDP